MPIAAPFRGLVLVGQARRVWAGDGRCFEWRRGTFDGRELLWTPLTAYREIHP